MKNKKYIGQNRVFLQKNEIPQKYTDQWFKYTGIDKIDNLSIIILSILYLKYNPDLNKLLFGQVITSVQRSFFKNKPNISSKQLNVLKNFIDTDLKSLYYNFPPLDILIDIMNKIQGWKINNLMQEKRNYFIGNFN